MQNNQNWFLVCALIVIGVLTRTFFHLGPNIEFVTAVTLVAAYFLKSNKKAILVPLAIMVITDVIIGNTLIFIFTWSAFILTYLVGLIVKRIQTINSVAMLILVSEVTGILSTVLFFLWTNFGVVVTTSMYPKSLEGVMLSYINALPFLRNQLYANMLIVPVVFGIVYFSLRYKSRDVQKHHILDR